MKIAAITISYNDNYKFDQWFSYYNEYKEDIYLHIIVDNGSEPEYLSRLESVFQTSIIIKRKENGGCTRAYNDGIRYAMKDPEVDSIMLIGNDIRLSKKGVALLHEFLYSNNRYGMVSPIMFAKDSEIVENYGCYFDFFYTMQSWDKGKTIEEIKEEYKIVDLVPGGMNMAKRSFYEEIGLQDENLFMYSDEPDICLRAKEKSFLFATTKKVFSWHQHINPNATVLRQPLAPYLIARNYIYISKKHFSLLRYGINLFYFFLRACMVKLKSFASSKEKQLYATYLVKGMINGIKGNMDNTDIIKGQLHLKK